MRRSLYTTDDVSLLDMTNEAEKTRYLHLITLLLPKGNRDTAEVLFVFLKWVASFSHVDEETGNKMDLHNLATVISPNIFRSYSAKASDSVRVESLEGIRVMDTLLEHQDEFYLVPEEFLPLIRDKEYFQNYVDLPSKEFLKKCENYQRMKANGRAPGLSSPIQGSSPFSSAASNLNSMSRDGSEARLAPQKSDPALGGRGRAQQAGDGVRSPAFERMFPSAPHSLERAHGAASPSPSEPQARSGYSSRQQSPPPRLQHQPFSHPGPANSMPPMSQPRAQDADWFGAAQQQRSQTPQQVPPTPTPGSMSMSASLPGSTPYTPRTSGEQGRFSPPNGHPPNGHPPNGHAPSMQMRQRT